MAARLDSAASGFFGLNGAPGMAVVVVQGDRVIYRRAFGLADVEAARPFTPQTPFYIASATKSFTGLAAAILAQRGVWNLDAPLSRYLPGIALRSPLSADSISIRSLLSHTHGIANGGPLTTRLAYTGDLRTREDLRRALGQHAAAQTGRAYAYGNIGYNVAAMAMVEVTGKSWQQVLEDEVLGPAGMTRTSAFPSRFATNELAQPYQTTPEGFKRLRYGKTDENMHSAGGLITTLDDMARWLEAHLTDGRVGGRQVFPAAAILQVQSNQTIGPVRARSYLPQIGYGFGWQVTLLGEDTLLTHGGGFPGFSTNVSLFPSRNTGIAIFANEGDLGTPQVEILASVLHDIIRGRPMIPADSLASIRRLFDGRRSQIASDLQRRAARSQVLPLARPAYTGSFANAHWGTIRVSLRGDVLEFRMGVAQADAEVFDADRNQLRVELLGSADVVTAVVENGAVVALEISGVRFIRQDE
jgi:CubicO group peptidase (beta-lactamase class C family)